MIERIALGLLLAGLLAVGAGWWGYRTGRDVERAACLAQRQADEEAAERQREAQRIAARAASAEFERQRREREARRARTSATVEKSLGGPASCAGGALGDLGIPAGALDGVRDAAGGAAPAAGSAASEPRR